MADPSVGLGRLTDPQRETLQMYTAVTDQDLAAAIPLLQRSEWNIQIAIAKFYDGETADPLAEARAAQAASLAPQQSTRREVLLDGLTAAPRSLRSSPGDPAPRIVPQPEDRNTYNPPLILSILFSPFNIVYRILAGSLGLLSYLFPIFPRLIANISRQNAAGSSRRNTTGRRPLSPRDTAARFTREFEEEYGSHNLQFYQDGYAQAYDLAKEDVKFLLVVLFSPEHDDTNTFVMETLLSSEFETFVNDPNNNIILWAGNVQDSEAYQVSIALKCTKFPFAALIVHTPQDSSTSMSTIARVTGLLLPSSFVSKLKIAIAQQAPTLEGVRSSRAEQRASRNLRTEQNSAYERSLAQDRERARLRREAEAEKARIAQDEKVKEEALEIEARMLNSWKKWKAQQIAPEPGSNTKDAVRISLRMLSGDRIIRRFAPESTVEDLYAFVECHDIMWEETASTPTAPPQGYTHEYKFNLVSPMPRVIYDVNSEGSISERVGRSGNLIVEPIVVEEEEE